MKNVICLLIILFNVLVGSCSGDKSAETVPGNEMSAQSVADEQEIEKDTVDAKTAATATKSQISFNGIIISNPNKHSTVTMTMGGVLHSISVFTGDFVRKGQVIARLKNPDFIKLQQDYLTCFAQAEYLEKEYRRQELLASNDAASQKKLQQCKAEYMSMKSNLQAAKSQLALLDVNADRLVSEGIKTYLEVKAPISGYVTNMDSNLGKYCDVGEPVCDIIDKAEPMLQLTAYEKDIYNLSVGSKVEFVVNGMGEEVFNAEIISIDQMVNNENRSINVYARIKSSNSHFRPGMYVNAKVSRNL